jgi:hypothetical protein
MYPPAEEEDWWTLQPEVVEEVLQGAGNCLPSLLRNRSQPSVGSADPGRSSADLCWTMGSNRDLDCNTGGGQECSACDNLMEVVLYKICGESMMQGDSLL